MQSDDQMVNYFELNSDHLKAIKLKILKILKRKLRNQ